MVFFPGQVEEETSPFMNGLGVDILPADRAPTPGWGPTPAQPMAAQPPAQRGSDFSQALSSPYTAMFAQAMDNLMAGRTGRQRGANPITTYQSAVARQALLQQREQAEKRAQEKWEAQQAMKATPEREVINGQIYERQSDGSWMPVAGEGKQANRKIMEDAAGRQRYVDTGEYVFPDVETPEPDNFEKVAKLRKEFRGETQVFQDQQASMGRILASAEDPSAAGDLALIFNYMKLLDPGSTVREGEFATAQNAAGVPARARALYNQVVDGTRLADGQRLDFVERAVKLYEEAGEGFKTSVQEYTDLAETYGFPVDEVILRSMQYGPERWNRVLGIGQGEDEDIGDIPLPPKRGGSQ
jgi:hypothetical protein